jgi:ketosteroid isomerase-like protein
MKRVLIIGMVCMAALVSCGGKASSPSDAAKKFYAAALKGDAKAMEAVATPETVQMMVMFGEKAKTGLAEYGKVTDASETIDGDTAVVTLTFENGATDDIDLIKVDGKWKVTVNK